MKSLILPVLIAAVMASSLAAVVSLRKENVVLKQRLAYSQSISAALLKDKMDHAVQFRDAVADVKPAKHVRLRRRVLPLPGYAN